MWRIPEIIGEKFVSLQLSTFPPILLAQYFLSSNSHNRKPGFQPFPPRPLGLINNNWKLTWSQIRIVYLGPSFSSAFQFCFVTVQCFLMFVKLEDNLFKKYCFYSIQTY